MAHTHKSLEPAPPGRGESKTPRPGSLTKRSGRQEVGKKSVEMDNAEAKSPGKMAMFKVMNASRGTIMPAYDKLIGADAVRAVRQGLPVSAVDELVESGAISAIEVYDVVLPRKTLANRRAVGSLTADQSDKLIRVGRIIAKAETTFGSPEKAAHWLRRPTAPLNGEEPLRMLDTEAGARVVEELLSKIDHGIAA
jgi:putative toxin-antitoxin system antitoxin component (TIGR02293 family)